MASGSSTDETGPPHRIPDSPGRASIQKLSKHLNLLNSGGPAWGTIPDCSPPSADCSTGLIPETDFPRIASSI
ncbi:hypothetical protein CN059_32375 [Sinorhizobium medicae]|nr:hypothetical protein CN192_33490 [Sinorhizobium medicae]RVI87327.1 hypothetical protein CN186_30895 [Sinorhizobium medicae]RVJ11927.1 hypothetical protein CN184_34170 [Sinorhizobium medicae]RVJ32307.1 hypothetical protein CN176_30995 [Sinorhizobium medicae]RVJ48072.1 hypothetical protein CN178_33660 [Sinorhizobium medicae]